jgi:hypothetical protein
MHRQVLLLATAQALFQTVSILVVTIGAIVGGRIAPAPHFATAPIASMFLGTVVATIPASMWMARSAGGQDSSPVPSWGRWEDSSPRRESLAVR